MPDEFSLLKIIQIVVDIALVWYVLYKLIMLIRGTKAIQLLKGIAVVLGVRLASLFFNLQTLQWIRNQVIIWGFLAIIILFQPELGVHSNRLDEGAFFLEVRNLKKKHWKIASKLLLSHVITWLKDVSVPLLRLKEKLVLMIMLKQALRLMVN